MSMHVVSERRINTLEAVSALAFLLALTTFAAVPDDCRADATNETDGLTVTKYDLDVSFDFESSKLFVDCAITLHYSGKNALGSVPLYLFRTLAVTSSSDTQGHALVFTQRVASLPDWPERQINLVDVVPNKPLSPGETTIFRLRYEGYLLGYAELGMLYLRDHVDKEFTILRSDCDVYPQLRGESWPAMIQAVIRQHFDYRMSITVPAALTVANGGELVEKRVEKDNATFVYRNIKPAWRIDVAVSDFLVLEDGSSKVFAFRKHEAGGRKVLESLKSTLALYSGFFGPLRDFRGFSVIEIPDGWGSQADVTSIIQSAAAFENPEEMSQLFHEVAHQWNVASLDSASCRVESEGFATFMQYLTEEKLMGKTDAVSTGVEKLSEKVRRSFEREPRGASVPMIRLGEEKLTNLAYTKGGVFFAVMHELVGQDAFSQIIRRHYERFVSTGATTDQFVESCRAIVGERLDKLFDEWLFGAQSSELFNNKVSLQQMVDRYR